ncbi:PilZ domain-containing protein [Sphingomonas sp.]|uniref:PilZ domain-containing protein n=1 Tax=Sphingomonas sp. TaxID=28214 RepID=UPI001D78DBEA|nr:PilZ domain-containing protein [Sphingomonas sp.]MBX9797120.1 PilZ domain-containing protein [Sphingomonas sp.]
MDQFPQDPFESVDAAANADRHRVRDSLFLMASVRVPGMRDLVPVRVRNLSSGGLMAETPKPIDKDIPVEVDVRGIGWVSGRVAWCTQGRLGISFNAPIDPMLARKPVVGRGKATIAKPITTLF